MGGSGSRTVCIEPVTLCLDVGPGRPYCPILRDMLEIQIFMCNVVFKYWQVYQLGIGLASRGRKPKQHWL